MRKLISLTIVTLMAAALLAACGGSTSAPTATEAQVTATPTPITAETVTATATTTAQPTSGSSAGGDASDIADRASKAFRALKSAHFDMTVEASVGDQAGTITATGDMQLPNRTHMTMEIAGMNIEIITIGTDAYTKVGDKWEKTSAEPQTTDPKDIVGQLEIPSTAKKLADETVDGTDCYHLQYTAKDLKGTPSDSDLKDVVFDVFIAKDTDLVKKMVIVPQVDNNANAGATLTMTFSKYNEPVSIEAPV